MWDFIQRVLRIWAEHNAEHVLNRRVRLTIAQINAGADIVAALPGHSLRLIDAKMIAVGGAAGGTTTVDIIATLAAVSRKLVAVAIAALTQSAVVRAGAANSVVLADGASFTANDVNTPIRAFVTGAALTTATHIDFDVTYALSKV